MKLALPRANVIRARSSTTAHRNGASVQPASLRPDGEVDPIALRANAQQRKAAHKAPRNAHSISTPDKAVAAPKSRQRAGGKDEWRPIATFVVEFELHGSDPGSIERRTRVHHHETMVDKAWPGFVRGELCDWIAAQLQSQIDAAYAQQAQTVDARAQPLLEPPLTDWRLATVRVRRAAHAGHIATLYDHGRCTPALLAAGSPFVVELELERASTGADAPASVLAYQVRAHNRDTRTSIELGSAPVVDGTHAPGRTLNINVGALTAAGSYRLECVPIVAAGPLDAASTAIALLQIV